MIHDSVQELKARLAPGKRLLGLDVGSKTIGMAVSDATLNVAAAVDTIRRTKFTKDAAQLAEIIGARDVGGIVIGLPVSMDGSEGPACQSIRQFAANLDQKLGGGPGGVLDLGIAFWDERLSTAAVERLLIDEADMPRKRRRQVVDKMAATYILQGALDALGD
jgi:putative Holliday junction resolvase